MLPHFKIKMPQWVHIQPQGKLVFAAASGEDSVHAEIMLTNMEEGNVGFKVGKQRRARSKPPSPKTTS